MVNCDQSSPRGPGPDGGGGGGGGSGSGRPPSRDAAGGRSRRARRPSGLLLAALLSGRRYCWMLCQNNSCSFGSSKGFITSSQSPLQTSRRCLYNLDLCILGVFSALRAVPQKEGYLGLYKGNGAMMIRIFPYGAIQFMAFEHYKTLITTKLGVSGHVHRLMAGSMAGMTAVICTYPLDMVRVRLAFQVKGEHTYTGIIHAFKTIYAKEGGFLGFYRGLMPTILGMAPYAGVSFFTFGTLKSVGLSHAPTLLGRPSSDNPNVLVLKTHINLLCGGVAGAIAQTISYPFDVTRRRMQLGTALPEFEKCLTMWETMKYVYGHHGIRRGLYRGLSLNYIRCVPSQAVAFTTYELMKQFFHLN
uniref:Solute carrier family 25 member 16 n=2 Tax=Canis lupus familiaris TaxID=9615 RepID=A0A8I3RQN4_CANLF